MRRYLAPRGILSQWSYYSLGPSRRPLCCRRPYTISSMALLATKAAPSRPYPSSIQKPKVEKPPPPPAQSKSKRPLCNEDLIRSILSRTPSATVDTAHVRLVLDSSITISSNSTSITSPSPSDQAQVQVTSLSCAIKLSSQLGVDLIGINMEQDPPVVKAVDLQKLLYKESKKASNNGASASGAANHKCVKEFQFRTIIDDHDMQRKIDNMISYLRKGHACQVMIQHKSYSKQTAVAVPEATAESRAVRVDEAEKESPVLRQSALALQATLEKIRQRIGTAGMQQGTAKMNDTRTRSTLYFHPNSKVRVAAPTGAAAAAAAV